MENKKTNIWREKNPFLVFFGAIISLLLLSPILYYFPLPSGHILDFHVKHPKDYPLVISIDYESDDPWCQVPLVNLGGLSKKEFTKEKFFDGSFGRTYFSVVTEYRRRGCIYNIKAISLEQGTEEDFDMLETKSLIDFHTRAPWRKKLSHAEKEQLFEEQKDIELAICPSTSRQGHVEFNDQFIYSLNGESYRVIPRRAHSGPNIQLLIDESRAWNISIQMRGEKECGVEFP